MAKTNDWEAEAYMGLVKNANLSLALMEKAGPPYLPFPPILAMVISILKKHGRIEERFLYLVEDIP